jgi:hypothetical protein
MVQTPWVKDVETALFSGVSKEKPRGGKQQKYTWGTILICPKVK